MNSHLSHRANIVAVLQSRLAEARTDDNADFLAEQLMDAGGDLERVCLAALREARTSEAMAAGIRQIEADNRSRRQRLESRAQNIRAAVGQAMAEAGLPKIVSADLTVSFRIGTAPIRFSVTADLTMAEAYPDFTWIKETYDWNKKAVRDALERGESLPFASLGNPAPVLTIRVK